LGCPAAMAHRVGTRRTPVISRFHHAVILAKARTSGQVRQGGSINLPRFMEHDIGRLFHSARGPRMRKDDRIIYREQSDSDCAPSLRCRLRSRAAVRSRRGVSRASDRCPPSYQVVILRAGAGPRAERSERPISRSMSRGRSILPPRLTVLRYTLNSRANSSGLRQDDRVMEAGDSWRSPYSLMPHERSGKRCKRQCDERGTPPNSLFPIYKSVILRAGAGPRAARNEPPISRSRKPSQPDTHLPVTSRPAPCFDRPDQWNWSYLIGREWSVPTTASAASPATFSPPLASPFS